MNEFSPNKQENYYSQFGEDRILAKIFADQPDGFCVEIGANDGVNDSTTFHFEKKGWNCLLVEPNPDLCQQIRALRSASLVECAVSDHEGEVTLFIAEGAPRAHGVSSIHGGVAALERIKKFGFSGRSVKVVARTLDSILEEFSPNQNISFMSIDVEGHELAVLKGFSLDRWSPKILIVEDNTNFKDSAVRDHLKAQGYVPFCRTGVNDWYARPDNRDLVSIGNRFVYLSEKLRCKAVSHLRVLAWIPGVRPMYAWLKMRSTPKGH